MDLKMEGNGIISHIIIEMSTTLVILSFAGQSLLRAWTATNRAVILYPLSNLANRTSLPPKFGQETGVFGG